MWACLNCEASEKGTEVKRATRDLCTYCVASLARTGRAWCTKGRHAVALDALSPHKERRWCRACANAAARASYRPRPNRPARILTPEQRERRRAQNRAYYARNAERLRARLRERYRMIRQRRLEYFRTQRGTEQYRQRQRVYKARMKLAILRGWR